MTIKTTGDLRALLADIMVKASTRAISLDYANVAIKAAAQINESFYAEIKTKQIEKSLGQEVKKLGTLTLND